MSRHILEICVDSTGGLAAALAGGADRIELCAALALGGLTPTASLMRVAAHAPVPVHAMIRPRAGDFVFSESDVALMLADIDDAHAAGLAGVVLGASRPDGRLNDPLLQRLHDHAAALGLAATLHRAFDHAPDLGVALESAIRIGFARVLTSGGAETAPAGLGRIAELHQAARGRIVVMPGSGVRPETIGTIARRVPVTEMHASASEPSPEASPRLGTFGFDGGAPRRTSRRIVNELKHAWRAAIDGHADRIED